MFMQGSLNLQGPPGEVAKVVHWDSVHFCTAWLWTGNLLEVTSFRAG